MRSRGASGFALFLAAEVVVGCDWLAGLGERPLPLESADASDATAAGSVGLSLADSGVDAGDAASDSPQDGEADSSDDSDSDARQGTQSGDNACDPDGRVVDFYVDPNADAGGCVFPRITLALAAARMSTAPGRTIHVASGTYASSTGESFPLDLRGGISLVGADPSTTTLSGVGLVPQAPPHNALGSLASLSLVFASILVGDSAAATTISGLSMRPVGSSAGTEAILCDRGTAVLHPPAPNTTIRNVVIDGFEIGVRATTSSDPPSGCNLLVTGGSRLQNGWFGAVADGLVGPDGLPQTYVSIQLGDGTESGGNTFRNFNVSDTGTPMFFNGSGLATMTAVSGVSVRGNHFLQDSAGAGDIGIWALQDVPDAADALDIENNDFGPLTNSGITLQGYVTAQVIGNSFHDISMTPGYGFVAVGLNILSQKRFGNGFPVVTRVRSNTFFANDIGVTIDGLVALPNDSTFHDDFGTAADPGRNTFRCNSAAPGLEQDGRGGDVIVHVAVPQSSLAIPFEGNVWDHAPPTVWIGAPPDSIDPGTDLYLYGDLGGPDASLIGPNADYADASVVDGPPCPGGRVTGP